MVYSTTAVASYRGFRANYTLSSHCGPISTRRVDRSIPTVDIEFGSARYSAWRALRAASWDHQQLPVPAGLYRYRYRCMNFVACTSTVVPYRYLYRYKIPVQTFKFMHCAHLFICDFYRFAYVWTKSFRVEWTVAFPLWTLNSDLDSHCGLNIIV